MKENKIEIFNAYHKCKGCGDYISYKKETCKKCEDDKIL